MSVSARDSLWTKTFPLDNICSEACDVHLGLQSPFRSAPPKSVLDFKKERVEAQKCELKIGSIYKNQEMGLGFAVMTRCKAPKGDVSRK